MNYTVELFPRKFDKLRLDLVVNFRKSDRSRYFETKSNNAHFISDPNPWIPTIHFKFYFSLHVECNESKIVDTDIISFGYNDSKYGDHKLKMSSKMDLYYGKKKNKYLIGTIKVNSIEIKCFQTYNINENLKLYGKTPLLSIIVPKAIHVTKVSEGVMYLNRKNPNFVIKIRHVCSFSSPYVIFYDVEQIQMGKLINVELLTSK